MISHLNAGVFYNCGIFLPKIIKIGITVLKSDGSFFLTQCTCHRTQNLTVFHPRLFRARSKHPIRPTVSIIGEKVANSLLASLAFTSVTRTLHLQFCSDNLRRREDNLRQILSSARSNVDSRSHSTAAAPAACLWRYGADGCVMIWWCGADSDFRNVTTWAPVCWRMTSSGNDEKT